MCKCGKRTITACIVCCGLLLSPLGATNPPAAAVGHVLTAGSTVAVGNGVIAFPVPNMVTGAAQTLPTELARPGIHEPVKRSLG